MSPIRLASMSLIASVKRGRNDFLVLASFIVINESAKILLAFSGSSEEFSWLSSVLSPALMILAVWSLWQTGENWTRLALATWTMLKGLWSLWALGHVMYLLADMSPADDSSFFFKFLATLWSLQAIQACFFAATGLALFFSPSIRIFLETRSKNPEDTSPFSTR